MNVLDFKKDMGLWHGVLTVSVFPLNKLLKCKFNEVTLPKTIWSPFQKTNSLKCCGLVHFHKIRDESLPNQTTNISQCVVHTKEMHKIIKHSIEIN